MSRVWQRAVAYFWRAVEVVLRNLPPQLAFHVDWLRPSLRAGWGGPLNGQVQRQRIARELFAATPFDLVVETGAFRGNSTEFFAQLSGLPVITIEHNPRYAEYARRRCVYYPGVQVLIGDSREHLRSVAPTGEGAPVFYYLDAHWGPDLPLREELATIRDAGRPAVVMIDDFQVPDDAGYNYDDYGPGARLAPELLDGLGLDSWLWLVPGARASEESGRNPRGCVVLVHPTLAGSAGTVAALRPLVRTA